MGKDNKSNVIFTSCKKCSHKKVCKHKKEINKELATYREELKGNKESKLTAVSISCKHFTAESFGFGSCLDDLFE